MDNHARDQVRGDEVDARARDQVRDDEVDARARDQVRDVPVVHDDLVDRDEDRVYVEESKQSRLVQVE